MDQDSNRRTPLHGLHRDLAAKMVAFAGYDMPLRYPAGILGEHRHTRDAAGLFDVSHMGQATVRGDDPLAALEALIPADLRSLPVGGMRYATLTGEHGGILDDLIVTRIEEGAGLVVNASRKEADLAHLEAELGPAYEIEMDDSRALLALQGPASAAVLEALVPGVAALSFMSSAPFPIAAGAGRVSRCGYTGEDGFEISLPGEDAEAFARRLLERPEVAPAGLGARDSLRLEAGLCLHGHDIDDTTTPVEAGLRWTIAERRRRDGGFPGAAVILAQLAQGPPRRRVGIRPDGPAPAREGTAIEDSSGARIGRITSGGFGPTVGGPVAMGYVAAASAKPGTELGLVVRGKSRPARVAALPFVAHRYVRERGT